MTDDRLTTICEDLIALRDDVADNERRPSATDICRRLTTAITRIEACYALPQSGGASGSESGDTQTEPNPGHEVSGQADAETPGTEVTDATVHTSDIQSPSEEDVRLGESGGDVRGRGARKGPRRKL